MNIAASNTAVSQGGERKLRVMVVFGGRSGEHQISCSTAAGVLEHIDREIFDVIPVGVTPDGRWLRVPDDPDLYRLEGDTGATIEPGPQQLTLVAGDGAAFEFDALAIGEISARDIGMIDVMLPLLHGPFGEDGTLQGMLEMSDFRYVGCGVTSSAVCMAKHMTKALLAGRGLPVGQWKFISPREWVENREGVLEQCEALGLPLFVKPSRAGSSLGITKVESFAQLGAAIDAARQHDPRVIVEAMASGREIECAVLAGRNGSEPRVAPLGEIVLPANDGFYDYRTKYVGNDANLVCPAPLPENAVARIQECAIDAFETLECEGLARVDFFYDDQTGQIIINEVNTMPGLTPFSLFPLMWSKAGLSYRDMITELITMALERPMGLR
ncbi:D-alanine--D-alanine ligase family protein [Boudabousia marimammalium]|uniref:D-alanine--D-alanine ligase n=1 Tax=Boudabousia marimammalium TaxID=156892 RepID=A0A1Q5PP37_9ACTO|nr:D-alanine--D-alanine ligase family protein [Boudabousia marimammalium]OKL49358.1 D-alanine--D-alanine ligase A [Boudabousia marimammalium]